MVVIKATKKCVFILLIFCCTYLCNIRPEIECNPESFLRTFFSFHFFLTIPTNKISKTTNICDTKQIKDRYIPLLISTENKVNWRILKGNQKSVRLDRFAHVCGKKHIFLYFILRKEKKTEKKYFWVIACLLHGFNDEDTHFLCVFATWKTANFIIDHNSKKYLCILLNIFCCILTLSFHWIHVLQFKKKEKKMVTIKEVNRSGMFTRPKCKKYIQNNIKISKEGSRWDQDEIDLQDNIL